MRKSICAGLLFILCVGVLSGCSSKKNVENSTVFVEKKGNIVSVDVENLDKEYYDANELETYITDHITSFTTEYGETVEKESFEVTDDGIAKLQMKYNSYEEYSAFNGVELYTGTVVMAQAAGYDFNTEFCSVSDDSEDAKKSVDKEEILANEDYKVVIIKANIDVSVPGKILYVSTKDTTVTGKSTVSITGEEADEEAALTYIIYK